MAINIEWQVIGGSAEPVPLTRFMFIAIFRCPNYYCITNYSLCLFVQPRLNGS